MKDGNKFLVFSKAYALKKRRQLLFFWIGGLSIALLLIGIWLAKIFAFDFYRIPLPACIIAFFVCLFFKDYFFNVATFMQLQMEYLIKVKDERQLDRYKDFVDEEWRDDVDSRNADDYKAVSSAIAEVLQMQMALQ